MSKIKVLNLIWSMGDGGAQQVVINYLRDFQNDNDIDFTLCVYTSPTKSKYDREIKEKGYNVIYLNNPHSKIKIPYIKRYFNRPIGRESWKKIIKEIKPDIVHVHISALLEATLPGIIDNNIPVRFDTLHSSPLVYKGKIRKIISKAFNEQNVIPICVTNEQVDIAKKHFGITKYEVVHNGVDINKIKQNCISKENARKKYNLDSNTFVLLGVGRLDPIKRIDLLIEIFSKLHEKFENSKLLIAGEGKEKEKLLKLVNKYNLNKSICFLGNVNNVAELYCAADVLAVTSKSESSSLVALEAQICGIRCVLSDGVPDETILLEKTQKMRKDATIDEWINAILDKDFCGKPKFTFDDYEVHNMSEKMKDIYIKYYNDSKKQK